MTSVSSESYYLTALIILPNKRCPKHTNEQRFKQRKSTLTQSYDVLSTYLDNTYLIVNSDSVGRVVCFVCGTWLIFTRFMCCEGHVSKTIKPWNPLHLSIKTERKRCISIFLSKRVKTQVEQDSLLFKWMMTRQKAIRSFLTSSTLLETSIISFS